MPRVHHVKHAAKDNPVAKKGEPYYWWKFRYSGKQFSKTPPRPSQLTQSEFLSTMYGAQEDLEDAINQGSTVADLEAAKDALLETIEELRDMSQNSLDNMPDQLQEGDTGQMLQERVDAMDSWESDLDSIDFDAPTDDDGNELEEGSEAYQEWYAEKASELTDLDPGL